MGMMPIKRLRKVSRDLPSKQDWVVVLILEGYSELSHGQGGV
jgi:hypothetical protein